MKIGDKVRVNPDKAGEDMAPWFGLEGEIVNIDDSEFPITVNIDGEDLAFAEEELELI